LRFPWEPRKKKNQENTMPLVTATEVLKPARAHKYAVGAFNCINLEYVRAVVDTAESLRSPVIVALTTGALGYAGWEALPAAVRAVAEAASTPVVMHLDHGQSLEDIRRALEAGFSSVMIDASHLPLEENILLTREAAQMAHAVGVSLEGELGQIGGKEEEIVSEGLLTDPEMVPYFVEATGLDVLAASFGSIHQKATRPITAVGMPKRARTYPVLAADPPEQSKTSSTSSRRPFSAVPRTGLAITSATRIPTETASIALISSSLNRTLHQRTDGLDSLSHIWALPDVAPNHHPTGSAPKPLRDAPCCSAGGGCSKSSFSLGPKPRGD
jgi:hypothetical protein